MAEQTADFIVTNHGTIVLFSPLTATAREWWSDNVADGMHFGASNVVEPRYAGDILDGIMNDGLTVH
jgi:hypothetical protein